VKPNRIRELLAAGKTPVGHMIMEFSTRGIAKIVEGAGVDFVLIDMEHSGFDIGAVNNLLAWFKATPVTPIVRVPSHDYHFIARIMDAGASGIMAANVCTAEEARAVAGAMRYAPDGVRGLGLGASHNDYLPPDPVTYMREANQSHVVVAQIESVTALENIDAIASTPGVDVLWVGHFDLTQSMGIVGQFDHPDFLKAMKDVAAACQRHGKGAGVQPGNLDQARAWMPLGYNVISFGADHGVYRNALRSAVEQVRGI
jgi:2-dehydro-3-deoxyglucarate aldolase/4-hydroxy-2-oxoheptanedioate aldolase